MPTLRVHVHTPGRSLPGVLTTEDPASSYGTPVLLLDGGPSHGGELVPFGPRDVFRYGPAGGTTVRGGPRGTARSRTNSTGPRWTGGRSDIWQRPPSFALASPRAGGWRASSTEPTFRGRAGTAITSE